MCGRCCVTEFCVKDGVSQRWCVTKMVYVKDGVRQRWCVKNMCVGKMV